MTNKPYIWTCPECDNVHIEKYEIYIHICDVCGSKFRKEKKEEDNA